MRLTWVVPVFLLVGCAASRPLMPTPSVYTDGKANYFENIPAPLRGPDVNVLFATDRLPEEDELGRLRYGYQRSDSLAFGNVQVNLGHDLTWEDLVKLSETAERYRSMEVSMGRIEELGRFPATPAPFRIADSSVIIDPHYEAKVDEAKGELRAEIRKRLALTPRKDVFVYVHGYSNTFEDAALADGEFWHFLGREGVPLLYSWPAGYPGLFGYTYDRESSEFTVFHFKQLLAFVSEIPEVKALHIVAHSRGTDVATAAIRELFLHARGGGVHPLERYKIQNLVLAAPDLDVSVVAQRFVSEQISYGFERITVYSSPADKAIGIAQRFFASPRGRLGQLDKAKLSPAERDVQSRREKNIFIRFEGGTSDKYGHSYFRTNPEVSSDIILLLRYELYPGTPERPLKSLGPTFWEIPAGYPNVGE